MAAGLEPFWAANCVHAETLQSLGCVSEALLLYEKLEMWDCVIECFKQLGQLEKAEALIRRLIEERPNDSMLVCFLGDITMETSYYETAIKMSNDEMHVQENPWEICCYFGINSKMPTRI